MFRVFWYMLSTSVPLYAGCCVYGLYKSLKASTSPEAGGSFWVPVGGLSVGGLCSRRTVNKARPSLEEGLHN